MNVDLPTLGKPTIATSAISFSSSRSHRSSPCSPCSANDGARRLFAQEAGVAPPALTGLGGQPAVAVVEEVGERFAGAVIEHDRALGHRAPRGPCPVRAVAVAAAAVVPFSPLRWG